MKKIVFSLILATSLFSCSNNEKLVDNGQNADMNETTLVSRLNNGGSVGEVHNYHVHNVYDILSNETNLSNHRIIVNDYFKMVKDIEDVDFVMGFYDKIYEDSDYLFTDIISNNIQAKIQELHSIIDNADFENEKELKLLINQYNPNLNGDEKLVWDVYSDTFYHSYVYWTNNINLWYDMASSNSLLLSTYGDKPCGGKRFFARMWCYVKGTVAADSASAAAATTKLLIERKKLDENGATIAAAGAASSVSYVIGQIFKKM